MRKAVNLWSVHFLPRRIQLLLNIYLGVNNINRRYHSTLRTALGFLE